MGVAFKVPGNCYLFLTTAMPFHAQRLESAISDTGKSILPQHLLLVADSLSATGEFVGLNAKGIAQHRAHASVSSPFMQACFSVSSHIRLTLIWYCFDFSN